MPATKADTTVLIYLDSDIVIYLVEQHLAAAIESGCDLFLTNDHRLARCTDLSVELLT